jgi:ABC-2 type transport system permease protein
MKNLVHAELLKLRTTRSFYGNAVAVLAFVPLLVALAVQTAGGDAGGAALDTREGVRNVLAAAGSGTAMVNIIGIMMMAGEFRHSTAVPTFLVTPDRRQVVGAKLIAVTVVGLGLAVIASVLTLAIAVPWLAAKDVTVDIFSADVALVLLGAGAATVLYGLIGVGVGSLVRNQTAAIVATLLWVLVVENSLVSFAPQIGRWVPSGASNALTSVAAPAGGLLPAWGGGLVLLAYGLAFAAAGARFAVRRDVA